MMIKYDTNATWFFLPLVESSGQGVDLPSDRPGYNPSLQVWAREGIEDWERKNGENKKNNVVLIKLKCHGHDVVCRSRTLYRNKV